MMTGGEGVKNHQNNDDVIYDSSLTDNVTLGASTVNTSKKFIIFTRTNICYYAYSAVGTLSDSNPYNLLNYA